MKDLKNSSSQCLLWYILLIIIWITPALACSQNNRPLRIMFYNAENFFDTSIDSTREYNAFTPEGEQHWDKNRYFTKRNHLFKTIIAAGQGNPPAVVGFCEVENAGVLKDLSLNTPLKQAAYKVVHYESSDRRGIDVGLIYRSGLLTLVASRPLAVRSEQDTAFRTRDILYAKFETLDGGLLHIYINHWPSRYGGQLETVEKRALAATVLRHHFDSLSMAEPGAKAIMMGDFNDQPGDPSVLQVLRALPETTPQDSAGLIQLFSEAEALGFAGTLKHGHDWQIFDQVIVSHGLYHAQTGYAYCKGSARIFNAPFLFEEDERYLGEKLFRTYSGPTYVGGYSDHLPVFIDLCLPE